MENKVFREIIRYASCWEDTENLLRAGTIKDKTCVSVISGGDNTFSLLTENPAHIIGFDLNPKQIALFKLKASAFRTLSYEELLEFLGIYPCENRLGLFDSLPLEDDVRKSFQPDVIEKGIIHAGKFEHYFQMFRDSIIPLFSTQEQFRQFAMLDNTADQKEYIDDNISARLSDGITAVDIVSTLGQHTEENIYCRTDHHWMPLGAYYAAQTFANAAGVDFKDISTFKAETISDFVGTMYAFSQDINIKNDPEDFTYYIPDNYDQCKNDFYDTSFNYDYTGSYFKQVGDPQSNAYLTFFGGDEQIVKIRTNVKNGRKLLIVKDSYGNAIPSNLTNSFEEIYIIDMRYFNLNLVDFINQLGMTDVLFTMCVFSAFGNNSYGLPDLLTQAQGQTITDNYDPNA